MTKNLVHLGCSIIFAAVLARGTAAQQSCESLTGLKLAHASITSSTLVPEGPFRPAGPGMPSGLSKVMLPAHCEVKGVATPTPDSEIRFEVWLPAKDWNGRFQQDGNGGWAG
ncbi:MAG TPA: hypothetical protein VJX67_20610, partial [Blastocatellia bacterium]|nr:hypothetical protein [Blastocatellia bacterium]